MKDSYWALIYAVILLVFQFVTANKEQSTTYFVGCLLAIILSRVLSKLEKLEDDED